MCDNFVPLVGFDVTLSDGLIKKTQSCSVELISMFIELHRKMWCFQFNFCVVLQVGRVSAEIFLW